MGLLELIDKLGDIGFVGGLIAFILLLYTKKLRWGSEYDELRRERDRCLRAAIKGTRIASTAIRVLDEENGEAKKQTEARDA